MEYKIIAIQGEEQHLMLTASRINDPYLIQEVQSGIIHGWFDDKIWTLFRNGKEIDPMFVLEKAESRYENWLTKKQQTHKLISIATGVCCLKQNCLKVWVKK